LHRAKPPKEDGGDCIYVCDAQDFKLEYEQVFYCLDFLRFRVVSGDLSGGDSLTLLSRTLPDFRLIHTFCN
jgi:hypothetical protein